MVPLDFHVHVVTLELIRASLPRALNFSATLRAVLKNPCGCNNMNEIARGFSLAKNSNSQLQ